MKIQSINPPKLEWVNSEERKPHTEVLTIGYGIVNVGSLHECFGTFPCKWSKEINAWIDIDGERIDHEVNFWLNRWD